MTDDIRLNAIEQEAAKGLKGPQVVVSKEKDFSYAVHHNSDGNRDSDPSRHPEDADKLLEAKDSETYVKVKVEQINMQNIIRMNSREKEQYNQETGSHDQHLQSQSHKVTDERSAHSSKSVLKFCTNRSQYSFAERIANANQKVERTVGLENRRQK
ncbi:probable galacturonosyltransferase 6 [Hibiscus syriacus]|uniref:probable galacturonosyltransferase 6 n=1 Tax=Hibiscus syriacus TaxID=106335 RepID=UPI0019220BC2|nr:probable galacturonosyltransferase 6 [Hibiscus syriacus]